MVHPAERKYTDLLLWDFENLEIDREANNLTKFKIIAQMYALFLTLSSI